MSPDDANRFCNLIRGMGRTFGNEPDQCVLDAYWVALRDWELDEFEQACGHLLKTAKFMPRPADFDELRRASRLTSGEAWAEVLDHARNGYRDEPGPQDPRIVAAVRAIGGYQAIAMSRTDQTQFLEKRFAEHYDSISEREEIREAVPQIAGPMRHLLDSMKRLS